MFFSCKNTNKEVRDFLAEKNLPIGIAKNAYHVYKDSGRITSKLITPLMHDYSNRKNHPYNEFPNGLKIINFDKNGKDSTTITGNYGLSYTKTSISEIRGNVVVFNHTEKTKLETEQLFWDQNTKYFYTEKSFLLTNPTDSLRGIGLESNEDLSKYVVIKPSGIKQTKDEL